MGVQLYLERFIWCDSEARSERFPNSIKLGEQFEISAKTSQRSIIHFRIHIHIANVLISGYYLDVFNPVNLWR
jgi:hypothetical protein